MAKRGQYLHRTLTIFFYRDRYVCEEEFQATQNHRNQGERRATVGMSNMPEAAIKIAAGCLASGWRELEASGSQNSTASGRCILTTATHNLQSILAHTFVLGFYNIFPFTSQDMLYKEPMWWV